VHFLSLTKAIIKDKYFAHVCTKYLQTFTSITKEKKRNFSHSLVIFWTRKRDDDSNHVAFDVGCGA
jgi:hypothetical protein